MGLRFHEPQSFLHLGNYGWSLLRAPAGLAIALVLGGLWLAFLGFPLRRVSGALTGSTLGIVIAGCYARTHHAPFLPFVAVGASLGTLLGFALPRTVLGFALGTVLGLALRGFFIVCGLSEYALEAFAGGCLASYVMSLFAAEFWIVSASAMLGAAVAILAALPLASVAPERAQAMPVWLGAAWAGAFLVAMAVQVRLGPIHLSHLKMPHLKKKKA